jgi:hypothetical protein
VQGEAVVRESIQLASTSGLPLPVSGHSTLSPISSSFRLSSPPSCVPPTGATAPPSPSLLGLNPPQGIAASGRARWGVGLGRGSLRRDDYRREGLKWPPPRRAQTRAPRRALSAAAATPRPRRPRLREAACKRPAAVAPGEDIAVRDPCWRPLQRRDMPPAGAGEGGHSRGRRRDDPSREHVVRHAEPWFIAVSGLGPPPLGLKDADRPKDVAAGAVALRGAGPTTWSSVIWTAPPWRSRAPRPIPFEALGHPPIS